ncbi:MAG: transcriptional regulator with GAF, ATPase, and Fis domain [Planctomycetota bacterium]
MNPETLQQAALSVAQALAPAQVLANIVSGLAQEPGVALARIWLIDQGDHCDACAFRAECPGQVDCLHLKASAGSSLIDPEEDWTRTEGHFRRFPMGVRKVGRVGATGEPLLLHVGDESRWLARPDWGQREGIRCFAGQPLSFRGETVGVLAVFSRQVMAEEEFGWLRTFADQAAVALANARAFAEVQELREQLEIERDYLREEIKVVKAFGQIVGESPSIRKVLEQVDVVASTEATVLIEGESGTGKELVASALHERSPRADRPLVRVNCASIPRELFESEFFGHQKGSFTGAVSDRAGRFQVADGGTLFLDEVGEIPLDLQGKLLRALQDGQFSRIGEDTERKVDVRVVAATNRNLQREVRAGTFREDLYYRLTVFPIRVPPLRERKEDIPLIAQNFVNAKAKGPVNRRSRLQPSDIAALMKYDWPGNVRELQNVIERALILARGGKLSLEVPSGQPRGGPASEEAKAEVRLLSYAELKKFERENVLAVLNRARWKVAGPDGAAEFLGVNPATLASRLRTMGIERPRSSE